MSRSYSPIDESSYTDSGSFDPEEMLNAQISGNETSAERQSEPSSMHVSDEVQTPAAGNDHAVAKSSFMSVLDKIHSLRLFKFLGIILFFFAAYAFVVCCSYFFTIGSDQSAVLNGEVALDMYENAGRDRKRVV